MITDEEVIEMLLSGALGETDLLLAQGDIEEAKKAAAKADLSVDAAFEEFDAGAYEMHLASERRRKGLPPAVHKGSKGSTVVAVQRRLSELGYDVSDDGEFGPETEKALKEFQRSRQKEPDGVVGPRTLNALLNASKADAPSNGADVGIDSIQRTSAPGTSHPARSGRGLGALKAQQNGGGKKKDEGPRIDPVTGKPVADSKTGPIGSTEPYSPDKASYDGRMGTGPASPQQTGPSNLDFEQKHKRGRGGQFTSKGSSGQSVGQAQQDLNDLGIRPKITVDGKFGDQTDRAVRRFQRANGLAIDGVLGPKTKKAVAAQTALLRKRGVKFNAG